MWRTWNGKVLWFNTYLCKQGLTDPSGIIKSNQSPLQITKQTITKQVILNYLLVTYKFHCLLNGINHRLYVKIEDMTAPQTSQPAIDPWWLAEQKSLTSKFTPVVWVCFEFSEYQDHDLKRPSKVIRVLCLLENLTRLLESTARVSLPILLQVQHWTRVPLQEAGSCSPEGAPGVCLWYHHARHQQLAPWCWDHLRHLWNSPGIPCTSGYTCELFVLKMVQWADSLCCADLSSFTLTERTVWMRHCSAISYRFLHCNLGCCCFFPISLPTHIPNIPKYV